MPRAGIVHCEGQSAKHEPFEVALLNPGGELAEGYSLIAPFGLLELSSAKEPRGCSLAEE